MDDVTIDSWAACVDAVHEAGGHMLIQLWHEGALRKEGAGGRHPDAPTISPSGLIHGGKRTDAAPHPLTWTSSSRPMSVAPARLGMPGRTASRSTLPTAT
jgi:2,4-dienoyl-CoA reductase-like NADH-dependent reductase (Old Yellow Enzyme family)